MACSECMNMMEHAAAPHPKGKGVWRVVDQLEPEQAGAHGKIRSGRLNNRRRPLLKKQSKPQRRRPAGRKRKTATLTAIRYDGSYHAGFNAGFARGFEDGHQIAYEQPV